MSDRTTGQAPEPTTGQAPERTAGQAPERTAEPAARPAAAPAAGLVRRPSFAPRTRWAVTAVLAAVVVLAPFQLPPFRVFQLTLVIVYAVALLGLNLLVGVTGQISLGHGAFFAIGAYSAAITMHRYHLPYPATIPVAVVVTFLIGLVIGIPVLRLRGLYLALVTLAIAVFFVPLLKRMGSLTGGAMGLTLAKPTAPGWSGLADDQWLYYLTLIVATAAFLVAGSLLRSRVGRALQAIRDNETAAEVMGVRLSFYKTLAFAWSAMYAGLAGCVYTWAIAYVSPDSFQVSLSIMLLAGLVIGGLGSLAGPVLGAVFVEYVPRLSENINQAAPNVIFGLLIIAVMYVAPTGLAGLAERVRLIGRHPGKE